MNCKSGLIEILAWINFLHLHISHYKFLWKRFGIKDLDCVAEEKVEFSWVLGWFIRCYLKSFLYSRNYPFKGLYKKKNKTGKNFVTENAQFLPWIKNFLFTKVVSFHTKGFEPESYNRKLLSVYMLSIVKWKPPKKICLYKVGKWYVLIARHIQWKKNFIFENYFAIKYTTFKFWVLDNPCGNSFRLRSKE